GIYAAQGFERFLLLTGYKGEQIADWVGAESWGGVEIDCVDTGVDTATGGRIKLAQDRLGGRAFNATYADGLADVDLRELLAFHQGHEGLATLTAVRPPLQFGVAEIDDDGRVREFSEKPQLDHWINGGFFRFESGVLDYLEPDSVLEREPFERLAASGELRAHRHSGFWDCMDTYKDAVELNDIWATGRAPWPAWAAAPDPA
ncbi:MAG: nucleotidyl transferase, partial [Solirubrobacterales bacterium]|nr:nucleotidyl transferase [Solirubrobacterales bacterium]